MEPSGSNVLMIIVVLAFVSVVLLLEGLFLIWQAYRGKAAKKLQKRLQALSIENDNVARTPLLKQRMLSAVPALEKLLESRPRAQRIERWILQSGIDWTVSRLALSSALYGIVAVAAISLLTLQPLLTGLAFGATVACLPALYVQYRRQRRLARIEQQLPDALDLMTRAMRSGNAFSSALKMIGDEMPEPIANEFRIVHDEINFGVSMPQALANLVLRVPGTDLRYFVVAVLIQRESGGNLTEVLGNLSRLIRERLKLLARVRVLSSEGRLSAWILALMPFFLAAVMNFMNPDFMGPLWTDPMGQTILKYTLILMALGVVILRKIVKIRV